MNYLSCDRCGTSKCVKCMQMSYQFLKVLESRIRVMKESLSLYGGDVGYEMYMSERKKRLEKRMREIAKECEKNIK